MFQESSPSDKTLTAVAVYLLTGLLFVTMAIMEYAYLLWMRRRTEIKSKKEMIKIEPDKYTMRKVSSVSRPLDKMSDIYLPNESNYLSELTAHSYRVDSVAQLLSFTAFLIFNAIYWANYYS